MFKSINEMIENQHPVIVAIRWLFHEYVREIYKSEKQMDFDRWCDHIRENTHWTVWKLVKVYFANYEFRHDVNSFLKDQTNQHQLTYGENLLSLHPDMYRSVEVIVYDNYGGENFASNMFLVHTHDDVVWTNEPQRAANAVGVSLGSLKHEILKKKGVLLDD